MRSLVDEFGLRHVASSHSVRDVLLLFASRFVRMLAFGAVSPILVLHLRLLGLSDGRVGSFLSLTLLGDVLLSLVVTWTADTLGRRRVLVLGAFLMAVSGVVFHYFGSYIPLLLAAIIGIVSPSGNEVGPFSAIETGMLSQLVEPDARVYVLMWYQFLGLVGTSLGIACSGALIASLQQSGRSLVAAYQAVFYIYIGAAVLKVGLSFALTPYTEVDHPPISSHRASSALVTPSTAVRDDETHPDPERQPLLDARSSPPETGVTVTGAPPPRSDITTKLPVVRLLLLSLLFSIDSFGSSLVPNSFIAYYLRLAFEAPLSSITWTFAAGFILAGFSQLASGSVARRFGMIWTMVGTHIPAQILTIALAFAPSLLSAIILYLMRASISSMDGGVRGAFLSAIIPKESRTRYLGSKSAHSSLSTEEIDGPRADVANMGLYNDHLISFLKVINVFKTLATAPGPSLSGHLASQGAPGLRWSFVLCGALKILYDVGLLIGFRASKLDH
ncbi:BQ2448_7943 [Microbotryum intermedium]|uniref:BQ2448_7943 protein n=1 Tax=Microbotryum intermedium TaxID=269621 RepID=A0A238FST3_9BASI|nr:BQ2448_7943 [Microbotryum intermedium]